MEVCSCAAVARRMRLAYSRGSPRALPPRGYRLPPFNVLFGLHAGVSLLRPRPDSSKPGCGILTACPSTCPPRDGVRPRLTPDRLALSGNPWSFGEGVSRPLCRYLCLHLLFRLLQQTSRFTFAGAGMLPYRQIPNISVPRLRHRTYARLLSTRGRSTSELLRTLQMNGCFQANILAVCAALPRYCLQLSPDFGALDGGLSCSSLGRGP